MTKIKRTVSLLLALMMVLTFTPKTTAQAAVGDRFFPDTPMTHPNTYVNTGDQRKDIIGVALTQVGYTELNHSNNTKYGATLGINKLGWCGAFVSWCAIEAEIPNSIFPKTGVSAPSAFGFEEKYYPAYTPQPGDLFFAKDNSHVGLVYYLDPDGVHFWSLEGNVTYNTYEGVHIERHRLDGEKYCSPAYETDYKIVASGDCGAYGSHLNWAVSTDGTLTISGTGEMADYGLGTAPWYQYRDAITQLNIKEGTTEIGKAAFAECEGITSVTIPDSVTAIGDSAFFYCSNLATLNLGSGLTTIGESAFYNCIKLKNVVIPDSVTTIGDAAFYECDNLASLTLGSSLTGIGNGAFGYCTALEAVEFPATLQTIGQEAFWSCNSLLSITIPASVTTLGSGAFGVCTNLAAIQVDEENAAYSSADGVLFNKDKTVLITHPSGREGAYVVPDTVKTIQPAAFQASFGLTAVQLPESLTTIGESAFFWCDQLKDITVPNNVTTVGDYAFANCLALNWAVFGKSVDAIGSHAFAYCSMLTNVLFCGTAPTIGENAFADLKVTADYYPDSSWTDTAKQNYGGLITWVELECPHDYEGAETKPTLGAAGYTTYTCTKCGDSYDDDYTDIVAGDHCGEDVLWKLDIHGKLTIFGTGAMDNYEYVAGDVSSAPWAEYAGGITQIEIKKGVTTIGNCAFLGCDKVESVTIPSSVIAIGASAFQWCSGLKEVYFECTAPTIGANAFYSEAVTAYYYAHSSWTDAVKQNYGGTITWVETGVPGDYDGDRLVTDADVIHLLWYTVFPEDYPIYGDADFDGDGDVTDADVIYLLWHTVFPEDYPLR